MGRWHGLKSVNLKSVAASTAATAAVAAAVAAVAAAESYVLRRVGVGERERLKFASCFKPKLLLALSWGFRRGSAYMICHIGEGGYV